MLFKRLKSTLCNICCLNFILIPTIGMEQKSPFNKIKESIVSENILEHYNSSWELIIASDASLIGIGAVLSHRWF